MKYKVFEKKSSKLINDEYSIRKSRTNRRIIKIRLWSDRLAFKLKHEVE